LWAPKFLSPGLASLLLMTEIVVGAISAALLSDEAFGTRETIGVLMIAGASLVETVGALMTRKTATDRA